LKRKHHFDEEEKGGKEKNTKISNLIEKYHLQYCGLGSMKLFLLASGMCTIGEQKKKKWSQ
jgi:hypothetical protein